MYAYCLDFPRYRNTEIALNSKEITEINKIKNEPEYKGYLRIGEGELTKYLILKGLKSESEKEKQNFKE